MPPVAAVESPRTAASRSSLQFPQGINTSIPPLPEDEQEETKSCRHLDGGNGDDNDDKDLGVKIAWTHEAPEGDESENGSVEHDFNAHQHHQSAALRKYAHHADAKE